MKVVGRLKKPHLGVRKFGNPGRKDDSEDSLFLGFSFDSRNFLIFHRTLIFKDES